MCQQSEACSTVEHEVSTTIFPMVVVRGFDFFIFSFSTSRRQHQPPQQEISLLQAEYQIWPVCAMHIEQQKENTASRMVFLHSSQILLGQNPANPFKCFGCNFHENQQICSHCPNVSYSNDLSAKKTGSTLSVYTLESKIFILLSKGPRVGVSLQEEVCGGNPNAQHAASHSSMQLAKKQLVYPYMLLQPLHKQSLHPLILHQALQLPFLPCACMKSQQLQCFKSRVYFLSLLIIRLDVLQS